MDDAERAAEMGQWIGQFLHNKGHIYLIAVWKNEIKVVQAEKKSANSEVLAECCRCARELLNINAGFERLLQCGFPLSRKITLYLFVSLILKT